MHTLYTSTAMALMFGLATTAYAADAKTGQQSRAQQTAQAQQQPKPQTTQQQAGQTPEEQQETAQGWSGYQGEHQMRALGVVDTDNDGRISAEEAQAHRERIFSALDADQNKALSPQETGRLTAAEPGYIVVTRMIPVVVTADIGSQMLSEMDQDQNQRISRQEYMQYGEQQFQQAQEQAGGQLTTGQAGQAQTGQMQAAQGGQAQTGQTQTGQGQTPEWQQVVRWRESNVDINDDGIIAADEAASAWVDTFQRLDRNGDDQLTQDELEHMQAQKAMVDQRFAKLDTDGDGQIGLDEYASAGHDLMQLADFNEDGVVTAWEYRAVRYTDQ